MLLLTHKDNMMNILTFDIEEWFHIMDNETTRTAKEWGNYETRIQKNMERIYAMLNMANQKATFFCLGWIAETYPDVIREIANNGYEIGTHSRMHQLAYEQSRTEFTEDLSHSVKTLEDMTGQKVRYYRAPGFSIREDNKWAFEVLAELGIEVDCSVFPARRAHGGFPSYKSPIPSIIRYQGIEIKELPINLKYIFGKPVIFTGGGYFRLFPYSLIKKWTFESDYVMSYLHPRDFDDNQPIIKGLSPFRKFKSYVGLSRSEKKLEAWLSDFDFVDVHHALQIIQWDEVPVIDV
ncbi:MAG: polysaccharide deacetylase family protein [Clostridiales bacterium]|nr:polysaccharide deacetylase family protein [Clostridiales bacterium]